MVQCVFTRKHIHVLKQIFVSSKGRWERKEGKVVRKVKEEGGGARV